MRIGVFGGTFDPVHQAHLVVAEQCREQGRLDEVWFVPAARPPHKREQPLTPFRQRAEMLALAVAGNPAFRVDELERDRPGPSYTVDTLEDLRRRRPGDSFFLLIGADVVPDLPQWHEPVRILGLAELLVVERPGWPTWEPGRLAEALRLPPEDAPRLTRVRAPLLDVSSRDLRRRVGEGRSVRYLMPRSVECYINQHGLYRPGTSP